MTDLLETMRDRFRQAEEAEYDIRRAYDEDVRFRAGEQWPKEIEDARAAAGQPCLTINRLPQFERQILNEQRQNRPSINVSPVDDGADVETAKVFQGLIRHIEYDSNADIAQDRAFACATRGGFGYFRILTEYAGDSFDLEIKIRSIRDPKNVYLDPNATEPDGSDAKWGFIFDDMTRDDFEAEYPKAQASSQWDAAGAAAPGWISGKTVRVAEYYCIEHKEVTLYLLGDNTVSETLPEGMKPLKQRTLSRPEVRWVKTNGFEILEETTWPGRWVPIIPVYGDELIVDGKRILEGVIRHAKDSQRMYNYWASCETSTIALAPKAPYVMAEGQDEGHEDEWKNANRDDVAYLTYKPVTFGGQQAPPPQRQSLEPAVGAITQARQIAADDLKATTGIYDAALGARGNEQSGKAILARQGQSQTANFHLMDNLRRSIRFCARQLIDLIPKVYDTERVVRILGEDDAPRMVRINATPGRGEVVDGVECIYALGVGKYDVIVSTGPSYQSRRQEAAASMTELVRAYPQFLEIIGDLFIKSMDWPGAQEISDRLKRMLPDKLQDKQDGGEIPPQVQQFVQQLQTKFQQAVQQNQQLMGALQQAEGKLNSKEMELASRERIAEMQLRVELLKQQADIEGKASLATLKAELDGIAARLDQFRPAVMPTSGPALGEDMGQPAPPEPGME